MHLSIVSCLAFTALAVAATKADPASSTGATPFPPSAQLPAAANQAEVPLEIPEEGYEYVHFYLLISIPNHVQ